VQALRGMGEQVSVLKRFVRRTMVEAVASLVVALVMAVP
jgi:hypothetical protein